MPPKSKAKAKKTKAKKTKANKVKAITNVNTATQKLMDDNATKIQNFVRHAQQIKKNTQKATIVSER